ncbi:MAG TPA: hypothetical protein VGD80_39625 [Kofleriaceae bacterium]
MADDKPIDAPPSTIDAPSTSDAALVDAAHVDAAPDASPDAALPRIYDIVYGSNWEFTVDQEVPGWIAIVNTGTASLDLSTLRVLDVSDDHPTMNLTARVISASTRLQPGQVGGHLTPVTKRVTVDAGLVSDPTVDTSVDYLGFQLLNFTDTTEVRFNGTITIEIANRAVQLPMVFHITPFTGPILFEPSLGKRISAP